MDRAGSGVYLPDEARMDPVEEALARGKLRLGEFPSIEGVSRDAVLGALWSALRARFPAPGTSQDELVWITAFERDDDGITVRFRHVFDHDFHAQYDRTEDHSGALRFTAAGAASLTAWDPVR